MINIYGDGADAEMYEQVMSRMTSLMDDPIIKEITSVKVPLVGGSSAGGTPAGVSEGDKKVEMVDDSQPA